MQFADVERLIDTPMKRYSSGLYARLGFTVAIYSRPDIVLVDEVLAVGDAAFRRRALEALRRLIAERQDRAVHLARHVERAPAVRSEILWMEEGRVRAYGPAGEIAERYMNEVNLAGAGQPGDALQSHRGGTGEIRYTSVELVDADGAAGNRDRAGRHARRPRGVSRPSGRSRGRSSRSAIIDVDTGLVITTATSRAASMPDACRRRRLRSSAGFAQLPLRPRQYVLRLSITDSHQLASYDVVTAGPRFAVSGHGSGVERLADEEDGLVSLPFEFAHTSPLLRHLSVNPRTTGRLVSIPHGGSAGNMLRTGLVARLLGRQRVDRGRHRLAARAATRHSCASSSARA